MSKVSNLVQFVKFRTMILASLNEILNIKLHLVRQIVWKEPCSFGFKDINTNLLTKINSVVRVVCGEVAHRGFLSVT